MPGKLVCEDAGAGDFAPILNGASGAALFADGFGRGACETPGAGISLSIGSAVLAILSQSSRSSLERWRDFFIDRLQPAFRAHIQQASERPSGRHL